MHLNLLGDRIDATDFALAPDKNGRGSSCRVASLMTEECNRRFKLSSPFELSHFYQVEKTSVSFNFPGEILAPLNSGVVWVDGRQDSAIGVLQM